MLWIGSHVQVLVTSRPLEGGAGDVLRLRVGDYRVFFVYTGDNCVEIRRVRHRSEAYR